MIKLSVLAFTLMLSAGAVAQNTDTDDGTRDTPYCMTLQGSTAVLMANGVRVEKTVVLQNGTKIKKDGTILLPDGTTRTMKTGECLNQAGNSMPSAGTKNNTVIDTKPN